jgi:hypothetical protein
MVQVVQKNPDDLAKPQCDNGQIITPQLERRRTQQHTGQPGYTRTNGNHQPPGRVQALRKPGRPQRKCLGEVGRCQQPIGVGAHGKKGHKTQIEQAGIAHHDIQAQGQQHVQQSHVGNAYPGVAKQLQHQGHDEHGHQQTPAVGRGVEIEFHHVDQLR